MDRLYWPYNLIRDLIGDDWNKSLELDIDEVRASVDYVLVHNCPDKRYRDLIYIHYRDGVTLQSIGDQTGTSKQNISELLHTALRHIQKSLDDNMLVYGITLYVAKLRYQIEHPTTTLTICKNTDGKALPIEKLGLMPRAYNALKRNGANTVGDVLKLTRYEFDNLKGLGAGSRKIVIMSLENHGYECSHLKPPSRVRYIPRRSKQNAGNTDKRA